MKLGINEIMEAAVYDSLSTSVDRAASGTN